MSEPVLELFNDDGYIQINCRDDNYFLHEHGTKWTSRLPVSGTGFANQAVEIKVPTGMLLFIRGSNPVGLYNMAVDNEKISYIYKMNDGGTVDYWIYGRPKDIRYDRNDSSLEFYNENGEPVFISSKPHLKIVQCGIGWGNDSFKDVQSNGRKIAAHTIIRSAITQYEGDSRWGASIANNGNGMKLERAEWIFTNDSNIQRSPPVLNSHFILFADVTDHD